ncbi:type 2 lanthipeptide synthetase LanM [Brucella sp. NBRC 12950]|uniref:type 2 lanthipeptide synthetase LanM n=1 Tax=Brucella sp. NBRC 12950 TaxID=2994518 RepID=UPI0025576E58|nr:type 2 lanthipeptide synthetase LanM [Brucella sp. NBRC 12950]
MKTNSRIFANQAFSTIYQGILVDRIAEIRSASPVVISDDVLDDLIQESYMPVLRTFWERILILELNHADKREVLEGTTEEQRFDYFCRNLLKPNNLHALYTKYPGLQAIWPPQSTLIGRNLITLLRRIETDLHEVVRQLVGNCSKLVVRKITPVGDFHRGLQCGARIAYKLDQSEILTLYYKPRNLKTDVGYGQFVDWWNKRSAITHKAPRVVDKGSYGWVEAVRHFECAPGGAHNYYRRYGSLLAIASVFGSTDLHMENVIAHGEYPVIVDLETLFSCTPTVKKDNPSYYHSYASLLLPTHAVEDQVETSPLSASPQAMTDLKATFNPQRRKSTLRMEVTPFVTGMNEAEVWEDGQLIDFREYRAEVIDGCHEALEVIYQDKKIFCDAISAIFQDASVRVIFRATEEYLKIIYNSGHPVTLHQSTMQRDVNVLCEDYFDYTVLHSEITDLLNGDVPYFEVSFNGCHIRDGKGALIDIPLHHSPRYKFEHQLDRDDTEVAKLLAEDIEYAFSAYNVRIGMKTGHTPNISKQETTPEYTASKTWFNDCSIHAMDQIKAKMCRHRDIIYWRQINAFEDKAVRAGISEICLYNGLAGIALAYNVIGGRVGRPDFLALAKQISKQIRQQLTFLQYASLGAYIGTAGTIWALCEIEKHSLIPVMKTLETELSKLSYTLITTDYRSYFQMDIVSGVAGTLEMLIRLHALLSEYPISAAIQRIAELAYRVLLRRAPDLIRENTLIGYAHGTAGVSSALADYMTHFSFEDPQARKLIEFNVLRETSLRTELGWPDLDHDNIRTSSWCHGTNGFGFSRRSIRPFMSQTGFDEDMAIVRNRIGTRYQSLCLCHGLSADYYLAKLMGWSEEITVLDQLRDEINRGGLRTDFGLTNFEMVGAMNGVSGVFIGDHIL